MLDLEQRSVPPTLTRNADPIRSVWTAEPVHDSRQNLKSHKPQKYRPPTTHHYYHHHHYQHDHHTASVQPPSQTKAQVGPPDSCTSLPLWLTQLGFSSFILVNPGILVSPLSCFRQTNPSREELSWRTNGEPPSLCLKLWPTL